MPKNGFFAILFQVRNVAYSLPVDMQLYSLEVADEDFIELLSSRISPW
jgi:hypothetical protein